MESWQNERQSGQWSGRVSRELRGIVAGVGCDGRISSAAQRRSGECCEEDHGVGAGYETKRLGDDAHFDGRPSGRSDNRCGAVDGTVPKTATVYETTLDRAEAASSRDLVPGTEPVLLFVFSGHFRMEPAVWPPPPGSRVPPPHGSHVTFIVSKATGDGLGGGISSWPVLTAGLGKAHVVVLR